MSEIQQERVKANTAAFFCTVCCAVIGFTSVGERPPLFPVSLHLRLFAPLPRLLNLAEPGGHLWDISFDGWACVDLGLRALFFAEALGGVAVASLESPPLSASTGLCAWCAVEIVGVVLSFTE